MDSQNPPKTLPKCLPNRTFKKHAIFHRFFRRFSPFFNIRFLENRHFPQGKSLFLKVSLKTCFCKGPSFLHRKTYQKHFKNDIRNLQKSMSNIDCFSTSIFSGFGLDFGAPWASKMEPSWLKNAPRHGDAASQEPS